MFNAITQQPEAINNS